MSEPTLELPTSKELAECATRQDEFMTQHMKTIELAHQEITKQADPKFLEFSRHLALLVQVWGMEQFAQTGERVNLSFLLANAVTTGIWHGVLLYKQFLLEREQRELEGMLEVPGPLDNRSQFNSDCCPNCKSKSTYATFDQGVWRCKECHTLWTWKPMRKEGE